MKAKQNESTNKMFVRKSFKNGHILVETNIVINLADWLISPEDINCAAVTGNQSWSMKLRLGDSDIAYFDWSTKNPEFTLMDFLKCDRIVCNDFVHEFTQIDVWTDAEIKSATAERIIDAAQSKYERTTESIMHFIKSNTNFCEI